MGLLLCVIFGVRAFVAYQVVQRVEASSAVTAARGLDLVGRLFGLGGVADAIDPRNQTLYVEARQQMVSSAVIAAFGLALLVVALMIAATWQPTVQAAKPKMAMTAGEAYWAVWVGLAVLAVLVALAVWMEQRAHLIGTLLAGTSNMVLLLLGLAYVWALLTTVGRIMQWMIDALNVWPHWPRKPPAER